MSIESHEKEPEVGSIPDGLASRTAWLTAAKVIGMVLSFLLPILLVRKLTQSEYGLYKQAFQIMATSLSLLGLQISGSIYYFFPREPKKKAQIAMNATIFYLVVGAMVAIWFALNPGWVAVIFKGNDLASIVPLLGIVILLHLVASNFDGVMIAEGDIRLASLLTVLVQINKTILLLAAAFWKGSIRSLMVAATISGLIQCSIYFGYLFRRYGRFWWPIDWKLFRSQLSNSLPYGVGGIVLSLQFDLHFYFVSHYFDAAQFAIYSVGAFQLPLLLIVLDSVDTIMIPEITKLEKDRRYREIIGVWMGGIRLVSFCFIPAVAHMFVMRKEFITGLFTKNYLASVPIFMISLCNLLLLMNLTGPVLRAFADFRFYRLRLYLVLLPLTAVSLMAGVRLAGLVGAITAVVIIRTVDVGITSTLIGRKLGMTRRDLRYLLPILRIAAAAAVPAAVVMAVRQMLIGLPPLASFFICSAIFGLIYLVTAFMFGAVTDTETAMLRRFLGKYIRFAGAERVEIPTTTKIEQMES